MSRHARRRGGRHVKRPEPYQGWGSPSYVDEADQLAVVQSGHTPPIGFPAVQVPSYQPQRMAASTRWLLAGMAALGSMFIGAFLILALAFVMGAPPPAEADQTPPRVEQVTEIPDQRVRVTVDQERVKVVARQLCPSEESCTVNYVGDGTYVIERVVK